MRSRPSTRTSLLREWFVAAEKAIERHARTLQRSGDRIGVGGYACKTLAEFPLGGAPGVQCGFLGRCRHDRVVETQMRAKDFQLARHDVRTLARKR